MKNFKYTKLFGWFAAATLLLTTSCKDDLFEGANGQSDEVTVSFTLTPEAASTVVMRGGEGTDGEAPEGHVKYQNHIGDGSRADMLIYAVYDDKGNLLEGYSDGVDKELKDLGFDHGDGQTIRKIDKFPVTVTLTLKRGAKYSVAFWAQSSKTKAYNTSDLKKVEVIYSELDNSTGEDTPAGTDVEGKASDTETTTPNNDEFRDAFCRSVTFEAGKTGLEQNVLLYRPLAQINVGTSGYDFEAITRNAAKKYLYSKVRLNRVARYLDVVEDKVYHSTTGNDPYYGKEDPEAFAVVDFGFAPIPAYVNMEVPEYPSYTKWDWEYDSDFVHPHDKTKEDYEKEEFLQVHLKGYADEAKTEPSKYTKMGKDNFLQYANLAKYDGRLSETFKYLSMCYVLTASNKAMKEDGQETEDYQREVINNLKVWVATDASGSGSVEVVNLTNVPVQRNWRTNIVGSLLTENVTFSVTLDKDFAGEYNGWANGDEWEWSGPLADGVYYDAVADEIQISNANGLLWFQRMVNGNMTVREVATGNKENDPYMYYVKKNNKWTDQPFYYSPIKKPSDDSKLEERILRATHQKNKNNGAGTWPSKNNFHFCGNDLNDRATVKLMADIDLTNIEWVPIGFDGKIADTVKKDFDETTEGNRGFFGIFDGNGHTISNLSTKRFSAEVHSTAQQTSGDGPYDNPQWFGRGLFGEIGGNAKIHNVRLLNVDIYGCNGVGGVVGIAYGKKIEITKCVVDGGSIIVTPMFRGDSYGTERDRTFARGVYLGGIVGYFRTDGGVIEDCEVKNLYMQGYRRVGGLVGSINQYALGDGYDTNTDPITDTYPSSISNNKINNVVLIASQFSTFGMPRQKVSNKDKDNEVAGYNDSGIYRSGFGWDAAQFALYAHKFVGGHTKELEDWIGSSTKVVNNTANGLTFSEFTITKNKDDGYTVRRSTLQGAPLKYMPMLSSWFTDEINLNANYYGEPSAYTRTNLHLFNIWTTQKNKSGYFSGEDMSAEDGKFNVETGYYTKGGNTFKFPIDLPREVEIDWDKTSPRAGLYVESVTLDGGSNSIGNRSVITPTNVDGVGACAMYVTARNRHQFDATTPGNDPNAADYAAKVKANYKKPTVIKNVVLRGEPYAYTGILLAPNKNMTDVELENVAIYDVYQTIALDDWTTQFDRDIWPNWKGTTEGKLNDYDAGMYFNANKLTLKDCNLRGYTVPGAAWQSVNYERTTFEEGSFTNHGSKERTCKVDITTNFEDCFFKAPYIIDLSAAKVQPTFKAGNPSYATGASKNNVQINLDNYKDKGKVLTTIKIVSNAQGDPIVIHYYDDSHEGWGYDYTDKTELKGRKYDWNGKEIK